jgi:hypothetical protein
LEKEEVLLVRTSKLFNQQTIENRGGEKRKRVHFFKKNGIQFLDFVNLAWMPRSEL